MILLPQKALGVPTNCPRRDDITTRGLGHCGQHAVWVIEASTNPLRWTPAI